MGWLGTIQNTEELWNQRNRNLLCMVSSLWRKGTASDLVVLKPAPWCKNPVVQVRTDMCILASQNVTLQLIGREYLSFFCPYSSLYLTPLKSPVEEANCLSWTVPLVGFGDCRLYKDDLHIFHQPVTVLYPKYVVSYNP